MKTRSMYFASTCFIRGKDREAWNAGGNTKTTLQKEPMVTEVTPFPVAALQAPPRASCAFAICMICKVPLPTFLDTVGFQEKKWPITAGTLMRTLALETVVVTTLADACIPVIRGFTLLHTGTILEDIAIHALQAICPQGPAACVAAPVTLFACIGGEIKIVLGGTALILTISKEQDLVWISAGGTAGL